MFSDRQLFLPLLLSIALVSSSAVAKQQINAVNFKLTPATCVALQQGRRCYATVEILWQSKVPQELCLHAGAQKLHCWQLVREGRWRYEFAEYYSQQLQLISSSGVVAQATISVNWVQKNPRVKRHWRLF
jgi:hypothetical protein